MLNGLDLFSGIGGLSRALAPWIRTIAYCERDRYAQSVLLDRMADGLLDNAPIWDDIRTLRGKDMPTVDLVAGGFPCQDISTAGNGAGLEGKRSGLFFEIIRLCSDLRPGFVFLENVPAISVRGLDRVLLEFTALGYDCRWTIVSAAEMGAPHLRQRWFLLAANSDSLRLWNGGGRSSQRETKTNAIAGDNGEEKPLADSTSQRCGKTWELRREQYQKRTPRCREALEYTSSERLENSGGNEELNRTSGSDWWTIEPSVGRVAHGIPARVDRIRGLGNAVVPMQAREAFIRLMGI